MKNSWIKTSECLPYLHFVSNKWSISSVVLITTKDKNVNLAVFQNFEGQREWIVGDYKQPLDFVLEWQPIELSDPDLRDDLRDTQNYHLNT